MSATRARLSGHTLSLGAVAATAIGGVGCVVGALLDPRRAAFSYLVAYATVVAAVLGALCMIMIAQVTAANWFVVLRRRAEQIASTLPVLAVLFVPVAVALPVIFPWVHGEAGAAGAGGSAHLQSLVAAKRAYLNVPFFVARAVVYWIAWIALAELLRRASLRNDVEASPALVRRMRVVSAVGLPVFAITLSFASFDWLMSLTPTWYSTVFGVYYYASGMVAAMGLLALVAWHARVREDDRLSAVVEPDHVHAVAKLTITFLLFWAYIGYAQLIVIWSGNVPVEVSWYVTRLVGAWRVLAMVLLFGGFALPFLLLVVRAIKRSPRAMAALGVWLLLMHYLDIYWMAMPEFGSGAAAFIWCDAAALLFVCGAAALCWQWRCAGEAAVVQADPALAESVSYRTD